MQQSLSEINIKIQNYSPKFNIVDGIPDISIASDFSTHQQFWILRLCLFRGGFGGQRIGFFKSAMAFFYKEPYQIDDEQR